MARYTFPAFRNDARPRYIAVRGLQCQLLERQRLEASSDLDDAMTAAIDRLTADGWAAEGTPEYGFTFIRRGADRRLLMLTPRDPHETGAQVFSPFR